MITDAMNRDVWPTIIRDVGYGLYSGAPALEQLDAAFVGGIDRADNITTREEYLIAIRAALDSNIDTAAELGFAHPDSVVREFLVAVEKRLRDQLGE